MIKKIENEYLSAEINELGAELFSLKSKKTGTEYIWQGDPEYWKGRAPILFPICGRLYKGKYNYQGKEYEMILHGFAKLSLFTSKIISDSEIEFKIASNEDTLKQYPFDFEFTVKYALIKETLDVTYFIKNKDSKEMIFSFGAHPAFNVPFNKGEKFEDYYVDFNKDVLELLVMSENCLYTGKNVAYPLTDKRINLKHYLFDHDALFFITDNDKVQLRSSKSENYVEVSYNNMTCVGLWHSTKKDAPFLCIEPWHGIPADEGKTDDFENKRNTLRLEPNKTFENTYSIRIYEK